MLKTETTIDGIEVILVALERGERSRQIRESLGGTLTNTTTLGRGENFDDEADFADSFQKMYQSLKAAGADLSKVTAVMEIRK